MGTRSTNYGQPSLPVHFQLIEIWERTLGTRVTSVSDSFFDLGGHSLLLAPMMEEVERVTGTYVPLTQFVVDPTVAHLADCLQNHAALPDEVIELQRGNGLAPLYYYHGDILGGGFYARKLAEQLGPDQPVYSVAPTRISDDEIPTIEEIARRRIEALRSHRPHGPYLLGGFCIGAIVAFEVARQLTAAGEEVPCVFMINAELSSAFVRAQLSVADRLARRRGLSGRDRVELFLQLRRKVGRLQDLWASPISEKKDFIVGKFKAITGRKTEATAAPRSGSEDEVALRDDWQLSAFHWILAAYKPKNYPGKVNLFMTRTDQACAASALREWRRVAGQASIHPIPGEHLTAITKHIDVLAHKLREELRGIQAAAYPLFMTMPMIVAF